LNLSRPSLYSSSFSHPPFRPLLLPSQVLNI
jgi:hypothetical protein